ncbi:hypothetical protein FE257_003360 [Aspergillus nanangensis]|uniref:Uncharacterized protein n=1 Tax=Aspergillus nanangensis TaxID=2582783 RepID=A0AAD4GNJ7_ASPNN|nr:hypothetical protein FE257_003360 [Aspergillus nanangensis]
MANAEATSASNPPEPPNDETYSNGRPQPEDVLAGSTPEPYNFESFVDYLSQDQLHRDPRFSFRRKRAPDELNIPKSISASLLDNTNVMVKPPAPDKLEPAIRHAHHLLTESALIPFIQSYMVLSISGLQAWGSLAQVARLNSRTKDFRDFPVFGIGARDNCPDLSLPSRVHAFGGRLYLVALVIYLLEAFRNDQYDSNDTAGQLHGIW